MILVLLPSTSLCRWYGSAAARVSATGANVATTNNDPPEASMVYRRVTLLWIATLVMGGVAFAHPAPAKVRLPPARHGSWMSPNASMQDPWLYVAGFNNGVVSIFDVASLGHRKAKLIGQIAGIPEPNGIKLDANGNLYVAT